MNDEGFNIPRERQTRFPGRFAGCDFQIRTHGNSGSQSAECIGSSAGARHDEAHLYAHFKAYQEKIVST
jgi:hypothetical protein